MASQKQWKSWYGEQTPEEIFNENWEAYSSNKSDYNTMYQAYKKCERALLTAKEWGEEWIEKYIYSPIKQVVQRIIKVVKKVTNKVRVVVNGTIFNTNSNILWNGFTPQEGNQFYLVELMHDLKKVIWPKIGTTIRYTAERFSEHVGSKQPVSYTEAGVNSLRVIGIWDCGEIAPEEVESKIRSYLKRKYGAENYIKNDRFDCEIDYDDLKEKIPTVIKNLQAIEVY